MRAHLESWLALFFLILCIFAVVKTSDDDERDLDMAHSEYDDEVERDRPIDGDSVSKKLVTFYEEGDGEDNNEDDYHDDDNGDSDDSDGAADDDNRNRRRLCLSEECVVAAGKMISIMKKSVDPCEDFYEHVCGNFEKKHEPFEDVTRTMSFEMLRRENQFLLHNKLKKMPENSGIKALDNLKKYYDSCLKMEHGGDEKSIKTIIKKYGPWPVDGSKWDAAKWDFNKVLIDISTVLPVAPFFSLYVDLDQKNPNIHVFQISEAGLGIPKEYYVSKDAQKKKVRHAYYKYMMNTMKLHGYGSKAQISNMKDAYLFERNLAKIFLSSTYLRNVEKVYKRVSLDQLNKIAPKINLKKLVETWLTLAGLDAKNVKFVLVFGEEYFKNLDKLLRKTKKETVASYMLWKILSALSDVGGDEFREERFRFDKIYFGKKARSPYWETCVRAASSAMPFAYGRLYIDERFRSKFAKKEVKRIVMELKKEFASNLKNVHWMSEETKKKAKEKANAIKDLIAYPDYILDNKKLEKKYEGIDLRSDDYLGNALKLNMFNLKNNIKLLSKKRDRLRWASGPSIVNAFYSQVYNRIVFPAGILQPLFYHHDYPSAMKYGSIGTVIGHEITHAFDDKGRKYDKNGHLHQWWSSEDIKRFEKRADCMRSQYSSYSIYGKHMNGRLSCGENIADNGGVKIAFKAFKKHLSKYPNTAALPGLQHLTNEQLFFVSFAKIWCIIESKESTLRNIIADVHSYPKFRVKGALSNNEDFAKAFNCKRGSTMNPVKKCVIW